MRKIVLVVLGVGAVVASGCGSHRAQEAGASTSSATRNGPAQAAAATAAPGSSSSAPAKVSFTFVPLPAGNGDASFDFIAYEPRADRVWIPYARAAGEVDVFDVATRTFTRVTGFGSKTVERNGKRRTMGPSSAAVGDGVVYIGDRGTQEVCAVDATKLALGSCLTLDAPPDCLTYVPSTKELWVTTPTTKTITILDAAAPGALKAAASVSVDGEPEGYALDAAHGVFYTNLEDKDRTLRVDVKTRAVTANWAAGCGAAGPRGLRVDAAGGFVMVACTDHVQILDGAHGGAPLGKLDTGEGVDDIEYVDATKLLYVGAGKAARLTVARIGDDGAATIVAVGATAERVRNAVVDAKGNAYLVDPAAPRLLVVAAAR